MRVAPEVLAHAGPVQEEMVTAAPEVLVRVRTAVPETAQALQEVGGLVQEEVILKLTVTAAPEVLVRARTVLPRQLEQKVAEVLESRIRRTQIRSLQI